MRLSFTLKHPQSILPPHMANLLAPLQNSNSGPDRSRTAWPIKRKLKVVHLCKASPTRMCSALSALIERRRCLAVAGTLAYMAPEVRSGEGEKLTAAVDIFRRALAPRLSLLMAGAI